MRVGIIGFLHESNTFHGEKTGLEDFAADVFARGHEVRIKFQDSQHEIGGFFASLDDQGVEAIPLFAARALPRGPIESSTFQQLVATLLEELRQAGPLDGLLVAAHGAMVSETDFDADGEWLSQIRQLLGPGFPIVGTLDPHANLSPRMIAACDALIAYRTNPHIDQRARGEEAARLLVRTLRKEVRPCMAATFPPLALSIDRQATEEPPCDVLFRFAEQVRRVPDVISASILLGFPYADVPELGAAAIVVTDGDHELAQSEADGIGRAMWEKRCDFIAPRIGVDQALDQALAAELPVCLLDMGDNVGGGSPADGTWIAERLLARSVPRSLAVICDAAAVRLAEEAGMGKRIRLSVGGKLSPYSGQPLKAEFTVSQFSDGRFTEDQVTHGGIASFDQGPTAVLTTATGLTIVVTSRRMVPFSLNQLRSCGLDPASFRVLVAKGVNAPIAAYREVCRTFIRVNTPGVTAADMTSLHFDRRRKPMFPFEPHCAWQSALVAAQS